MVWPSSGDQEPFEIPGGKSEPGLGAGAVEFAQYKQEVEEKRQQLKNQFVYSRRKLSGQRDQLLDRYDKLWLLISNRRERDLDRQGKFGSDSQTLHQARAQELSYKQALIGEIMRGEDEMAELELDVDRKQNYLATFLAENAKIFSAVEKAEALDVQQRRNERRKHAHEQILDALEGDVVVEVGAGFRDRQDNSRQLRELRDEFGRLRENEEFTDDLVERLKNKARPRAAGG